MDAFRAWWRQLPSRMKGIIIAATAVVVILALAGVFGIVRSAMSSGESEEQPTAKPTETVTPEEKEEPAEVTAGKYKFKLDGNGMVEMPVTTDPAEAAAAAAAMAYSVDFSKVTRQEYVDIVVDRMTKPTPEYRGPDGEVHTFFSQTLMYGKQFEYRPAADQLRETAKYLAKKDDPERYAWWMLLNGDVFENLTLLAGSDAYKGMTWTAQPEIVMSEAEMREWDESLVRPAPEGTDLTPDTEGATLTQWWVLSEVPHATIGTLLTSTKQPAYFSIWCDAPADGGICGVAFTSDPPFPDTWPSQ